MRLTLECEHGTRTVEVDEEVSGVRSLAGMRSFAADAMPRCPYCNFDWTPRVVITDSEQAA